MGTTPVLKLPYPELTDAANVPVDIKKLADAVDVLKLTPNVFTFGQGSTGGTPDLDAYGTDATQGQQVYTDPAGKLRTAPLVIPDPSAKAATDPPGAYPVGLTLMSVYSATAVARGWPNGDSAGILTLRRTGDADTAASAHQLHMRTANSATGLKVLYRAGSGTSWSPWVRLAIADTDPAAIAGALTVAAGWTLADSAVRLIQPGQLAIYGVVTRTGGTISVGTSGDITNQKLATLAATYKPAFTRWGMPSASIGRSSASMIDDLGGIYLTAVAGSASLVNNDQVSFSGIVPLKGFS